MNNNIKLVKVIADLAVFLEFTHEGMLDPDLAVEALEQMASELQLMDVQDRNDLANTFRSISKEYSGDRSEYVRELPESLGII
ncbi:MULTISPECIES: hypothetical protein [Rosenbergiella]|uniref:Uncharacterized protein n=1 Tax=Rosenbergiella gaditana TaxID=2726987 RepID=A0ABS5T028_9GAMM|nr:MULTISPECIES: hypothetical protein [Rosenbergiella]MBT0725708.1 hypothetical protein [Rosenbergiella gaditana]MBT0731130.1 hypothetical protein [Rosenbergiella nectarea subsp. apis]